MEELAIATRQRASKTGHSYRIYVPLGVSRGYRGKCSQETVSPRNFPASFDHVEQGARRIGSCLIHNRAGSDIRMWRCVGLCWWTWRGRNQRSNTQSIRFCSQASERTVGRWLCPRSPIRDTEFMSRAELTQRITKRAASEGQWAACASYSPQHEGSWNSDQKSDGRAVRVSLFRSVYIEICVMTLRASWFFI